MSIHSALADYLDQRREAITTEWLRRVRLDHKIPSADDLPREQLIDHMPSLLTALIEHLRGNARRPDETDRQSQTHGVTRQDQNYSLPELLREVSIFRNVLIETWVEFDVVTGTERRAQLESSTILHAILDGVIAESTVGFVAREQEKLVAANVALEQSNLRTQALNAQLTELDDRRLRMLRTITHEIANHLNATGFMVAFLKTSPDAAAAESSAAILRSISAMTVLMNQLMEFSTLSSADQKAVLGALDIPEFFGEVAAYGRSLATEKKLRFTEVIDPSLTAIHSDTNLLRRICFNLLSNAAKYTAEGSINLTFAAHGDTWWHIEVTDTGNGIVNGDRGRVFQEFFRSETARESQSGAGLGLAITRQLVTLLGGTIELESTVGEGSTFRVILPR